MVVNYVVIVYGEIIDLKIEKLLINFDFEKLRNFIITNRNKLEDHISISGGGDPLFNADVTNSTANLFLKKIIKNKKRIWIKATNSIQGNSKY